MYTDRQLKIIAVLKSADGWMSGSLLRENIGVSSRTLQMDIKAINEKQSGEPLIQSNNRLGYLLKNEIALEQELQAAGRQQEQKSYGQENYVHSKQIITLLLFEKEYTSIGTISERLFFSRSSVTSDLPQVKRIISRTPGANLLVSGQYGLKIQASENVKRIMCMKTMQSRQDYHMLFSEEEMEQFAINQKKIQAVLAEVFTRKQFIVSGEAYHDFARYLAVCIMRSRMGFLVTEGEDSSNRPGRLAMELVEEIEKVCGYHFQEMEKQNVEARLKELNMVCKETDIQLDMLQKLEEFIQRVQEETGLKLQVERDLLEVLSDHVSRMELRIQNGRNNIGNHTKEMAKRYPLEIHLLRTCLSPVLNTEIPDAEMGYLVLYFASAIERNRRKPDILFISDQSASSIYNVQNKLKGFLGERISEITVIPEYLFEQRREQYCRNYQLRITSEKELVLKDASFTYLDLFADNEQIMRLGRNVDKLENNYWKETEEKLRKKYGTKDSLYLIEEVADLDALKKRIGYEYPEQKVSKETIGSSRLSMTDHEQDGRNKIYRIYLKKPFSYGGKQITEVIAAHYGGEGDMIEFFDYVKELLGGQS